MIEEQAQVVAIQDGQLVLQAQTQSACGSCAVNKGCGTSVLAKVVGRKFTRFQVDNRIDAQVGDTVVVGIAEDALLKGSMMMYILPVMSMLIFAVVGDQMLADHLPGDDLSQRDLMVALAALIGFVSGALLSRWYFRQYQSVRLFSPVVLRKIIERDKLRP
jgi:sigma-E factor negative regulatory protein RseC